MRGLYEVADLRWFTPTQLFWDAIEDISVSFGVEHFVDVGTGRGDLVREAKDHSISMSGVDMLHCPYNPDVRYANAGSLVWSPTKWPIVCRPCHSGFPKQVRTNAKKQGAHLIYVGFRKNLSCDVGSMAYSKCIQRVGLEKESLYVF